MNEPTLSSIQADQAFSRRRFIRNSSLAVAGAAAVSDFPFVLTGRAAAADMQIKIGVIGCGGRGTGALLNAMGAATKVIYPSAGYHTEDAAAGAAASRKNIQVIALADLFEDRLEACRQQLHRLKNPIDVPKEHCFTGFDAYKQLLAIPEINYVIQATPPHFRPVHVKAAVEAGKNVFAEKPGAVDGPGVRMLMEAGEIAKRKNVGIVAGTQRRHRFDYQETIKRILDGAIGTIDHARCYWNGGEIWVIERKPGMSDMEWQLRNWNYFTWAGGDHIVEQHVHNLDVMNWVLDGHPVKAYGMGGRQARKHPIHGHIYDHFAVEFEYPNGVRMFSQCRQMAHCEGRVAEAVVGSKGYSNCQDWIRFNEGRPYRYRDEKTNPYEQEHEDLINSIAEGKPLNEAQSFAESTLSGIMGRETAYSGQTVTWDQALNSKTRLGPTKYEFGPLPFPEVPVPGKHKLV